MANIPTITPFRMWCLNEFPFIEATMDAIDNYDLWCKIVQKLNEVIDDNNKVVALVNEMKIWFDNLDVQEEINNKLDEMAESGQLTDIIAQYLRLAGVLAYNTVADMKSAENLANGSIAYTLGAESYLDGDGSFYKIRTITSSDVVDEYNIVSLDVSNTLIAERILFKKLRYYKIKTTDTFDTIQNIFNVNDSKVIEFETGEYTFTDTFRLNKNTKILLNNSNLIFNVPMASVDPSKSHGFFNFKSTDEFLEYNGNGNIEIIGGTITHGNFSFCHAKNITFRNIDFELCNNDHILEMCAINGLVVENCLFNGQNETTDNFKEMIQIDDCTRTNFPWFDSETNPTYDNTPNTNWKITNNIFQNPNVANYTFTNGIGGHTYIDNVYHTNILIENNYFNNSLNMSLQLNNTKNVIIRNNRFYCDNATAITNSGCHIRFRSILENITIENNIIDGNQRAIESAVPHTEGRKNLNIFNNIILNNTNHVDNLSFINLTAIDNCIIKGNLFKNFINSCIRTNFNVSSSDNEYYIIENIFESSLTIPSSADLIKPYDGKSYIIRNTFDLNSVASGVFMIVLSSDSNKVYALDNKYNNYLLAGNKTLRLNTYDDSALNIENYLNGYAGSASSLTNQALINNAIFSNYKKAVLTLGAGSNTYTIQLLGWDTLGQAFLDARTYNIPVSNGYVTFTINSDGTFDYNANSTGVNLRTITLYNTIY